MEKIHDSITKRLPPLRLYLDELHELYDFITSCCKEPPIIETCGYRLSSLDEVPNLAEDTANSILFSGRQPFLQVRLTSGHGEIYIGDGGVEAEGIASRVEAILLRGRVSGPLLLDKSWLWSLVFGLPVTIGIIIHNSLITYGGIVLVAIGSAVLTLDYLFTTRRYNTIVFRSRKDSPAFWKRNKDQIILLVIGAVIGAIITVFVGMVAK